MNRLHLALLLLALAPAGGLAQDQGAEVDRWIEDLGSPDYEVRERASQALVDLGPAAAPVLEERLAKIEDLEIAERIRIVLSDMRYPGIVGLWTGSIDGNEFTVVILRQDGRWAVGANTCHWDTGPLTCGLEMKDSGRDGTLFLDEPRDVAGAGRYVAAIDEGATEMSGTWTYYGLERSYQFDLRRQTTSATVADLESWLSAERVGTRCSAIHAIALLEPDVARPLLEKALKDADEMVRREAEIKLAQVSRDPVEER